MNFDTLTRNAPPGVYAMGSPTRRVYTSECVCVVRPGIWFHAVNQRARGTWNTTNNVVQKQTFYLLSDDLSAYRPPTEPQPKIRRSSTLLLLP